MIPLSKVFCISILEKTRVVPNLELRKQPGSAVLNHRAEGNGLKSVKFFTLFQKTKMFLTFEKKLATLLSVMH